MKTQCKHGHERTLATIDSSGYCRLCKNLYENERRKQPSVKQQEASYQKQYRKENPSTYLAQKKRNVANSRAKRLVIPKSASTLLCESRKSARLRGLEFTLTLEDVTSILSQPCSYGTWMHGINTVLGIDRKDNALGYTKDNSIPCCARHNFIKRNWFTYEEMIGIVQLYPRHGACGNAEWKETNVKP
jgi:hypothetical protein